MAQPSSRITNQEQDQHNSQTAFRSESTQIQEKPWYKMFIAWVFTLKGSLVTIYMLNVIAWGGMVFLLSLHAAPAMCVPSCVDMDSPNKKWIEIDSQILNAMFCVTAFGLIPWRFRDLSWLLLWRFGSSTRSEAALRQLAEVHSGWFRLGSQGEVGFGLNDVENPAMPLSSAQKMERPPSGKRAPLTASWKLDYVIWLFVWNTFFQAILCGFMWGYDRRKRPAWGVYVFLCLGMASSAAAGLMMFFEGRKVSKIEKLSIKDKEHS